MSELEKGGFFGIEERGFASGGKKRNRVFGAICSSSTCLLYHIDIKVLQNFNDVHENFFKMLKNVGSRIFKRRKEKAQNMVLGIEKKLKKMKDVKINPLEDSDEELEKCKKKINN